ncbi:MAG: hypothetical protein N2C14_07145 [Planctomycetales bacterium]
MTIRKFTFEFHCLEIGMFSVTSGSRLLKNPAAWAMIAFALAVGSAVPSARAQAKPELSAAESKIIEGIRTAMAERNGELMKEQLAEAKKHKGGEAFQESLERADHLADYLIQFWTAVDQGAKLFRGTEEIRIDTDSVAAFVEYDGAVLKYKYAGQMKRYTLQNMKPKVAVAMSLKVLNPNEAAAKIVIGSFWAMDKLGRRDVAERLWKDAKRVGDKDTASEVDFIMAELQNSAAAVVELPKLTPGARALLNSRAWLIQLRNGKSVKRAALGKLASQDSDGRLKVNWLDNQTGTAHLVFLRQASGNFKCQIVLKDVQKDQQFGLWSNTARDHGHYVSLPSGVVQVEFSRAGDQFQAAVNGEKADVQSLSGSSAKTPGLLGVSLPPGAEITIAGFSVR